MMVVMKCAKGHTPMEREAFNHAMPNPQGYRTALRFFSFAEKFGLPVVTFVDTVGAWPSFDAETAGQSEAIATNLTAMAGLKVTTGSPNFSAIAKKRKAVRYP